jgi:hypothetical protein
MKTAIWAVLAAVLFGALGFWGGVTYQKTQSPSSSFAGRFGGGAGGFGSSSTGGSRSAGGVRGANAANVATGTVISEDAQSITVKTADGGSKTLFVSSQTEISKQQVLTTSDIKVGDQIAAFGQAANGGIDARMVQIVPPGGSFRFGGGFGGPRGGGQGGSQGGSSSNGG